MTTSIKEEWELYIGHEDVEERSGSREVLKVTIRMQLFWERLDPRTERKGLFLGRPSKAVGGRERHQNVNKE